MTPSRLLRQALDDKQMKLSVYIPDLHGIVLHNLLLLYLYWNLLVVDCI